MLSFKGSLIVLVLISLVNVLGCATSKTYTPTGEAPFCAQNKGAAVCEALFRSIAADVAKSFVYKTDEDLYGVAERWTFPKKVNGKLYGDCEDCVIEIAERLYAAGFGLSDITLYLASKTSPPKPTHIVIEYGGMFADCDSIAVYAISPYDLMDRRRLDQAEWSTYWRASTLPRI